MKIPPHLQGLSKRDLIRIILSYEGRIEALEKRLVLYENAHTPPSKQRFPPKRKAEPSGKIGAPEGHKGATRETPIPTETKKHSLKVCPNCGSAELGKPFKQAKRIIEEIPKPQPTEVTEHLIDYFFCENCRRVVVPETGLPSEGIFGKNLLSHVTLLKFEDRLPLRKVRQSLKRQHGIKLTHTTVLDITRRVSDKLRAKYKRITHTIRKSRFVYTDQTDIRVNGATYQLWVFVTNNATLFIIRKGEMNNAMEEILGKDYNGIVIGDGLSTYRTYTDKIQRCWAHLLREAEILAEKHEGQARIVYKELKEVYAKVKSITYEDPPDYRQTFYEKCVKQMQNLVNRMNAYNELKKFATKISNGLNHWFTRILYPYVEATNNTAERALRELVVQRKIMGTLRNTKGTRIIETIMTMITTWQQRGLDTFTELRASL